MALPGVQINQIDGGLNLQPADNSRIPLFIGCALGATPNILSFYGDDQTLKSALVAGELAEVAGYTLDVAGGIVGVIGLTPTTRGGVSTPVKIGTGAETLTLSIAPHAAITITATTGGTLGTAAFTFQVGSAAPSAPVVSAAGWSSTGYLVPGTYVLVVFTAGTYVAGGTPDIYTISTAGAIAHPQGAGPAVPTYTASPVDYYTPKVVIDTAGALGTMQFKYSLDGTDDNFTSAIVSAGSGVYAIPGTGVVLTFAGTSVAGDYWTFSSAGPTYTTGDLTAVLTALQTTYLGQATYAFATVVGAVSSAAAWATQVAQLQTAATALGNNGVYVSFLLGGPTLGSILPNAGSITVDSADTDSVVITQRQAMSAPSVVPCAGDFALTSPVTGYRFRRNCAWGAAARAAAVEASQNIGAVEDGGIAGAVSLYRDEQATPAFDAAGITCMRTHAGSGTGGFYITDAHTATTNTSDFYPFANRRVVDRASGIARAAVLPLVNSKVPTTTRNNLPGVIQELKAKKIDERVKSALDAQLVNGSPQDAVATSAVTNRTNNVLATSNLIVAVGVQPYGYARIITVNIGMVVSAS